MKAKPWVWGGYTLLGVHGIATDPSPDTMLRLERGRGRSRGPWLRDSLAKYIKQQGGSPVFWAQILVRHGCLGSEQQGSGLVVSRASLDGWCWLVAFQQLLAVDIVNEMVMLENS